MIVNETTSVTDETPPTCVASNVKWVYLVIIPLPFIAGLLNILVWVAATFNRKKLLRHSYIYLCVSSTLLSNILFLTLHLWEEIATYLMDDGSASSPPNSMLKVNLIKDIFIFWLCYSFCIFFCKINDRNLSIKTKASNKRQQNGK